MPAETEYLARDGRTIIDLGCILEWMPAENECLARDRGITTDLGCILEWMPAENDVSNRSTQRNEECFGRVYLIG